MTLRFMLDTDTVSFAIRGEGKAAENILARKPSEICMSSVTLGELRFGAHLRRSQKLHRAIDVITRDIYIVPFDQAAANGFGEIAAVLAQKGKPIGSLDTQIAAHALALDLILVTNNTKHFSRVDKLRLDNWY